MAPQGLPREGSARMTSGGTRQPDGNAAIVVALMVALWVVSLFKRDASIVDPWWSIGFLLITGHTIIRTGLTPAKSLLLVLVAVWAVRLWLHLLIRSVGSPEDPRYAAFRARYGPDRYGWISLFQVFLLQAVLALVISAPLQVAAAAQAPDPVRAIHLLGALIFAAGFLLEAVADRQLQAFRDDPARRGQVLDTGLWGRCRHPNYFGEALLWWGFWLFAVFQPLGWATALSAALMTFLLVRVSGVTLLDAHLRASRPGYAAYMDRTPAFLPLGPKRG